MMTESLSDDEPNLRLKTHAVQPLFQLVGNGLGSVRNQQDSLEDKGSIDSKHLNFIRIKYRRVKI